MNYNNNNLLRYQYIYIKINNFLKCSLQYIHSYASTMSAPILPVFRYTINALSYLHMTSQGICFVNIRDSFGSQMFSSSVRSAFFTRFVTFYEIVKTNSKSINIVETLKRAECSENAFKVRKSIQKITESTCKFIFVELFMSIFELVTGFVHWCPVFKGQFFSFK